MLQRIRLADLPEPITQFKFADELGREFRVDFYWPQHGLIVEVDGGQFLGRGGSGSHVSRTGALGHHSGSIRDYRKRALIAMLGYRLLPFIPQQIHSGEAIAWIRIALEFLPAARVCGAPAQLVALTKKHQTEESETAARKTRVRQIRQEAELRRLGADPLHIPVRRFRTRIAVSRRFRRG